MITNPKAFWFLFLLIPVGLTAWRKYSLGLRDLKRIGGKWREEPLHNIFLVKWFFSVLTFVIFIVFIVFSLAGFSWGHVAVKDERKGLDIAILLDISKSMLARDVSPTRLDRSFEVIRGLIDIFPHSRYSLVLFKGEAFTFVPATEDSGYVGDILTSVSPGLLSAPGTDIEAGLYKALQSFPPGEETNKVIVLLSDGEGLTGDTDGVVGGLSASGVPVLSVGAGFSDGTVIELEDGTTVKNSDGKPVISSLHEEELLEIAQRTGGTYFHIDTPLLMKEMENELKSIGREKTESDFQLEIKDRYRLFLALALAALGVHLGIRIIRWKKVF